MAKRNKKDVAKNAVANFFKALIAVGSGALTPGLSILARMFGNSLVDEAKARISRSQKSPGGRPTHPNVAMMAVL